LKNRGISLFLPSLSLIVDWRERNRMNSSGLKVKVSGFRVKFVEVFE